MPDIEQTFLTERHTIGDHINISLAEILELYPDTGGGLWVAAQTIRQHMQARDNVRATIKREVADTESLLGTTADGAQLSVAVLMALISAIDASGLDAAFKTNFLGTLAGLAGNDHETGNPVDVPSLANAFLADLAGGNIKLTAVMKGVPAVIGEISTRATGVTDILTAAAAQQNS